jgi:AmmeMemoRadiSam system protein B/AmmeMemoRadiSam system protein A
MMYLLKIIFINILNKYKTDIFRKIIFRYKMKKYFIIIFIGLFIFFNKFNSKNKIEKNKIKYSIVEGNWYPAEEKALYNKINLLLENAYENINFEINGKIKAIIVPHAGIEYSGRVAAYGYSLIEEFYENIFVLGPSHFFGFSGCSINKAKFHKTPLGLIKTPQLIKDILNEQYFFSYEKADLKEHSIEMQLPFLQVKAKEGFNLIPIILGEINSKDIASILEKYITENDLIIASSDLSHYKEYEEAVKLDKKSIESILNLDFINFEKQEACGKSGILTIMHLAKENSWIPKLVFYENSGDITKDKKSVVGYASIVFYEPIEKEEENILSIIFSEDEKKTLLNVARKRLKFYFDEKDFDLNDIFEITENMKNNFGCFVTLTKNKQLRGCIGNIFPEKPLINGIIDNTLSAALNDNRFPKLKKEELKEIKIEISILTKPKELIFNDQEDLINKLRPKIDGVYLILEDKSATYLPQVWESFNSKKEFLESLCEKAGLKKDDWKNKKAKILIYSVEKFEEE